ncbi:MAG: DUF3598 family protein [Cyanobacteria bacterium P01_D01_bin.36]
MNSPTNPSSQWQRLLKNAGTWEGSFTQISPQGHICSDVRTEVELTPTDEGKAMHQEVRRYPEHKSPPIQKLDYHSLNRATLFFESGAFSQGSMQWGPFSNFGAELGLISQNRRLRLVQLYNPKEEKLTLTLIREQLTGTKEPERPPLQLSDLLGKWQGECTVQYADLSPESHGGSGEYTLEQIGPQSVQRIIHRGEGVPPFVHNGSVAERTISFTQGNGPTSKTILLPDGAYCAYPAIFNPRQNFLFIELGWLLDSHTLQRMTRSYDATGAWSSLTLITERKVT